MIVIGILLLAAIVRQEPLPPDVIVPEGWKAGPSSPAGGAIKGPNGEEILYPAYEPTGYMALTTQEADPQSLLVRAVFDRRRVDVAVREDGYTAVSYPPSNGQPYYGLCFDYWTRAKTVRQAAKALAICLTRLDVLQPQGDRDKLTPEELALVAPATSRHPFDHLAVSFAFAYTVDSKSNRIYFTGRDGAVVERQTGSPPSDGKWKDKLSVLGRTIRWGEDASGRVWAAGSAMFVSSAAKPQEMALAILAAMAYKPPGR